MLNVKCGKLVNQVEWVFRADISKVKPMRIRLGLNLLFQKWWR